MLLNVIIMKIREKTDLKRTLVKNKNLGNYYGKVNTFSLVSEPESQELIRPQLQTKPMTKK